MTPDQIRAIGALSNQSLLWEWKEYWRLYGEADKLYEQAECIRLEGDNIQRQWNKFLAKTDLDYYAKADILAAKGDRLSAQAKRQWAKAVVEQFGPETEMKLTGDDCTLLDRTGRILEVYKNEDAD